MLNITFKIKSWFIHVLSFIAFIFHFIPFISRNSLSRIPLLQVVACFIVGNPVSISLPLPLGLSYTIREARPTVSLFAKWYECKSTPKSFYNFMWLDLLIACLTKFENSSLNYELHVYTQFLLQNRNSILKLINYLVPLNFIFGPTFCGKGSVKLN